MNEDVVKIYDGERKGYSLTLESELLSFLANKRDFYSLEQANELLQKFVRLIEKKFDSIWYIGADMFGDELYERFMFHHGGFMEISLNGKIRCYFIEDKLEKMKNAINYACTKLSSSSRAERIMKDVKVEQKLISLKDSIINNINRGVKKK